MVQKNKEPKLQIKNRLKNQRFHGKTGNLIILNREFQGVFLGAKSKPSKGGKLRKRSHTKVNNISSNYTYEDVLKKIGDTDVITCCNFINKHLSNSKLIDLNQTSTYNFDHIIPTSKG